MSQFIRQSTVNTVQMGPAVSNLTGLAMNSLTHPPSAIYLSKNGGVFAVKSDTNTAYHNRDGYYPVPLNTTDTDTAGRLRLEVTDNSALPLWEDYTVVPGPVYDWLIAGTNTLNVGTAAVASSLAAGAITAGTLAANAIAAAAIATGALTAAKFAAGAIDDAAFAVGGLPNSVWTRPTRELTALEVAGIANSVWGRPTRAITDKDSFNLAADQSGVTIGTVNNVPGAAASVEYYPVTNSLRVIDMQRIGHAVMAGTSTGGGTTLPRFFEPGVAVPVVQATVDTDGNRRLVSLTPGY